MQKPQKIDKRLIGYKYNFGKIKASTKDICLYALGIGLSQDPLDQKDLIYTFERHKDFRIFPTMVSCLGQDHELEAYMTNPYIPTYDLHQGLHAQQRLYLVHPKIHLQKQYHLQAEVIDVVDKGQNKGAFISIRFYAYLLTEDGKKDLAYYIDKTQFSRQLGGSDIKSSGVVKPIQSKPSRKQDLTISAQTYPNQALIYRLVKDRNPLHADPKTAIKAKFQKPILHGLATYGLITKTIVQKLLNNQVQLLESIEIRFTGHVYPGESLSIKIWKEERKIFFEAEISARKGKAAAGVITVRPQSKL